MATKFQTEQPRLQSISLNCSLWWQQHSMQSTLISYRRLSSHALTKQTLGVGEQSATVDWHEPRDSFTSDANNIDGIQKTFETLRPSQRDNFSSNFVQQLSSEELKKLSQDPEGHKLLDRMVRSMNQGFVSDFEGRQIIKAAPLLYPKHGPLITDELLPEVRRALAKSGAELQSLHDGAGRVNFDEYSIVVDKMPPGLSPEQALQTFGREPNETLDNAVFNTICYLDLQSEGNAKVGDIYEIDLFGPNNGDVMVKNAGQDFLEYTTIRTPKNGTHPENGTRRFGFENNEDGSITFYSRSVSRTTELLGDNGFIIRTGAKLPQIWCGQAIMQGISDKIEALGGKIRPDSIKTLNGPQ